MCSKKRYGRRDANEVLSVLSTNRTAASSPETIAPSLSTSVVGKVFKSVIERRPSDWSEENNVFADEHGWLPAAERDPLECLDKPSAGSREGMERMEKDSGRKDIG
jgi:hypothetical protein